MNEEIIIDSEKINIEEVFERKSKYEMNFKNVKGQRAVKRALEVAAAGRT